MSTENTPEKVILQNEPGMASEAVSETAAPAAAPQEEAAAPAENEASAQEESAPVREPVNLADKTLAQLSEIFRNLMESADKMSRSKEADSIKAAFYRLLNKIKEEGNEAEDALVLVEENFKSLFNDYKRERAEFNLKQEQERAENLKKKQAIIEELKNLVESQEDVSSSFPAFREIQNRWRETGPVPATNFRDVNDTYQHYVEMFYDMVKINRDLRDLDFKKNLEAKTAFCEAAEKLAENENVVSAFHDLQKLHEQWKEFGPVAKEFRDDIWNRFKAATAVINKRYQAHFEELKGQYAGNLEAKTKLCEEVEEIAGRDITSSSEWNSATKEIEEIQARWRTIGFASKKENQKIYERFRAACDAFFLKKRDFYAKYKDNINDNLEKKMSIIEKAEALKDSTEWKKATDQFIALQKQWKEIGAVPRKKSEQLWKRFRAACDAFFENRDKQGRPQDDFHANLKAKKALIEEINAYDGPSGDEEAMRAFAERWQAIGFVPFKEKEAVQQEYRDAMSSKFPSFSSRPVRGGKGAPRAPRSEKDVLVAKYNALQQDIDTYENNIGFFTASKNSEVLIAQMRERIESAKAELKELEEQIRKMEASEE